MNDQSCHRTTKTEKTKTTPEERLKEEAAKEEKIKESGQLEQAILMIHPVWKRLLRHMRRRMQERRHLSLM